MNLAQALRKKNELVSKIGKLEGRVKQAMSYTEGRETYTQEDYDRMRDELATTRNKLLGLKQAMSAANRVDVDGTCVQDLIIKKGELKSLLDFVRQQRVMVDVGRINQWDDESPEQIHRENAKDLDTRIDDLETELRETDDQINSMNGKITVEWGE